MSTETTTALIMIIPPTIMAIIAVWTAFSTHNKVQALTVHINSRMDQLLELSKQVAEAKGLAAGRLENANANANAENQEVQ